MNEYKYLVLLTCFQGFSSLLGALLYIEGVFALLVVVMQKWFNTAGPCQADIHYILPSTGRLPELV
ncbi:MAG: hypothetical protein ACK5RE_19315, partial [Pseudanabaena sp.]